jgi:hypothetical protein
LLSHQGPFDKNAGNKTHQVSHDVAPDEENLDESNEVIDTDASAKKKTASSRVGVTLASHLEASKKINMGSVLATLKP